jgi:hypothetical protein
VEKSSQRRRFCRPSPLNRQKGESIPLSHTILLNYFAIFQMENLRHGYCLLRMVLRTMKACNGTGRINHGEGHMKTLIAALIALALMAGCAVVPVGPYYGRGYYSHYHGGYHGGGYGYHGGHGYGR